MNRGQVFRCNVCGNIVTLLHVGGGELVCCGQPMELLQEKTKDVGFEKHVPVIEKIEGEGGVKVKVGSIPHPMEEAHFIEWISIFINDQIYTKFLKPGDAPEAQFKVEGENIIAKIYCNLHGLWRFA
ncbi:MAG: desulfoferrodoxin [Candidatus Daviesbacteria bacterium]|nr:desulfoferrodoxin [Candidatus Daviesbacteria bacterium]